jgi:hypothetical protein
MLVQLLQHICRRGLSSTCVTLDVQMKRLNDQKKYRQAMDLYERSRREKNSTSRLLVDQALRALIELRDFHRAIDIENEISSDQLQSPFIRNRLIRLHSQLFVGRRMFWSDDGQ